jgi:hypothetical protein
VGTCSTHGGDEKYVKEDTIWDSHRVDLWIFYSGCCGMLFGWTERGSGFVNGGRLYLCIATAAVKSCDMDCIL